MLTFTENAQQALGRFLKGSETPVAVAPGCNAAWPWWSRRRAVTRLSRSIN